MESLMKQKKKQLKFEKMAEESAKPIASTPKKLW